MTWNVYCYDLNSNKIMTYNIFRHGRFREDVTNDLKECNNKDEFAKRLKSNLHYYFWSKCEWEILIKGWLSNWLSNESGELKADVYDQVMLNWDIFPNYVWSFK